MPTENRSSNTEMVSDILPCPFCKAAMRIESNRDWHRLMGDHDDECVFIDPETMTVPATDEQRAIMVNDWNRRAQPAEQHQGEPVARVEVGADRNACAMIIDQEWLRQLKDKAEHLVVHLYTHADPGEVERLREELTTVKADRDAYAQNAIDLRESLSRARQAHAGSQGLLQEQIDTLRAQLEAEKKQHAQVLELATRRWGVIAKQDAQLAERDALLHRWVGKFGHLGGCATPLRDETKAALYASAEPSAPIAWHVGGNGYDRICFEKPDDLPGHPCIQAIHDQRQLIDLLKRYDLRDEGAPSDERQDLTDEQIIEAMRPDLNSADGGYVVDTAPDDVVKAGRALLAFAEPSAPEEIERAFFKAGQDLLIGVKSIPLQGAPAEIDERAAFEAYMDEIVRVNKVNGIEYPISRRCDLCATTRAVMFEGWQARAALERKP